MTLALPGVRSLHTRDERRKDLQVGELASQPIRSLRQQASDSPMVLMQPSSPKVMIRICLQVDFGLFLMPPAIIEFHMPVHNGVVAPLQLFRC